MQGHHEHREQGQGGSHGKGDSRSERRLHGFCCHRFGDTEFIARVRRKCVVGHQLLSDLLRERPFETARHIDVRQLRNFKIVIGQQFVALDRQVGLLRIGL
jgi:hypothetical protein